MEKHYLDFHFESTQTLIIAWNYPFMSGVDCYLGKYLLSLLTSQIYPYLNITWLKASFSGRGVIFCHKAHFHLLAFLQWLLFRIGCRRFCNITCILKSQSQLTDMLILVVGTSTDFQRSAVLFKSCIVFFCQHCNLQQEYSISSNRPGRQSVVCFLCIFFFNFENFIVMTALNMKPTRFTDF